MSSRESVLLHTGWVASFCLLAAKDLELTGAKTSFLEQAIIETQDLLGLEDAETVE